jgi:hypothetical protein
VRINIDTHSDEVSAKNTAPTKVTAAMSAWALK